MKKLLVLSLFYIAMGCLTGCSKKPPETQANEQVSTTPEKSLTEAEKLKALKEEALLLRGANSIKEVAHYNGKATIAYVKDFAEYQRLNPASTLTKEYLEGFWEGDDEYKKALVDGPVRLMRKLYFLEEVAMHLPYNGKTYSVKVNKPQLEAFTNISFAEIKNNWDANFLDKYVNSEDGREKFFQYFGKVE